MIKVVHIAKPIAGVGVSIQLITSTINSEVFDSVVLCNEFDAVVDLVNDKNKQIKRHHVNLVRSIHPLKDIICFFKIIKLLKKEKPNIIHCHSAKAGILGRLAGAYLRIPTLYTPHAYSYLSARSKIKRAFFKSIEKQFKKLPSKTVACSKSEYDRTINDLKFPKEKVLVWSNSIEDDFKLEETNQNLPKDFICSIGRPSFQKNTKLLIHSLYELKKNINNIHLVILGIGHYSPDLEDIKRLIKKLDLENNITMIPWLKREETLSVLKKAIMYISTSRYEGLPYALIEALTLSKACVVTNVDGNRDLVKNGVNGYVVEENSIKIAAKVYDIMTNENLKEKMQIESKKYSRQFNISHNMVRLEEIYLQLI